ncbi:YifB family Mg chelatase-like AAA ATPase [Curtobacterium sp. ISL-83]|uniref:YifB family Mg chelatase-like AAA ATPase n=1 Tax=Curtobacterium sp. ISL-83 TaxID=2819145 RepID=UPI001BE6D5C7|nr:YifB family Mg chelatase-like AAA ATPase [Curtobacterium sp. ISL-83]MBT2501594.1 YifB family Mg chelatase-like AAA ATPase [Curtobacterium sp. ISL-83]
MTEIGRAAAVALVGVTGRRIEVEAHLTSQLPAFTIIGLPDTSLGEARERVRSAAVNAGCPLPSRRITVNLTPAAIPKRGSGFDLAIAMAVLAGAGLAPAASEQVVYIGELGLDGRVRPVPGVIPMVLAARDAGAARVVLPVGNLDEARVVSGIPLLGVDSLRAAAIDAGALLPPVEVEAVAANTVAPERQPVAELADVVGNEIGVRAVVAAAAGGHHVLLLGPPGAGKTMLAERLPGILPDLDDAAALEVAAVRSVAGHGSASWTRRPPWEAPHHSASAVALIGGGSGVIRPGAVSRATRGVLFLDEAPEFPRAVLDALRQPLESGRITVHRAAGAAEFPARCQVVLAANPCPCGNAGGAHGQPCECPPGAVRRYLGRMSGPLLDRMDIRVLVPRVTTAVVRRSAGATMSSARAREVVAGARDRMAHRLRGTGWTRNAEAAGAWLRSDGRSAPGATTDLDRALDLGTLTMRGWDRVMRLAWTLTDLAEAPRPTRDQVRDALALRSAL